MRHVAVIGNGTLSWSALAWPSNTGVVLASFWLDASMLSSAQRSAAHATDTTKTPDDAQPKKTTQCQEPPRRRGSLGRRVISPKYALYGTHSASTAATLAALGGDNREVFGRAPVAASVVALLTTARLGRRSKGKARLARRCVAVAQRRRRAGQAAVAACVLGTRADGEADAADTNHAQVHA